ncbi:ABC transporter substrate-binding protein [Streptomyces sp. V4-01]|uniref:ABC transporter substrate-binding protein n=1 Tax=Actinacidiphila polyblastidii TaxID=3110430 RepID=A0ABU7PI19_9ACTN|nr:ABC transporter substrate-binding protein [Streptomyces sp. V4-01]
MTAQRARGIRRTALALLAASALLSGCGVIPGGTGGSPGPVVVMTWAPVDTNGTNKPGMLAMAQVYEKYVNARGGIGGRKLKVLTCNERDDSAAVRDCARQASDAGAVAVVGSYSERGGDFISALQTLGIPYLGGFGITEDEFQSLMSYPVNGGMPALLAGSGRQLADLCRNVTLVRPDSTTGDQYPAFLDAGLKAGGEKAAKDLPTPDDATDYTQAAATAVGDDKPSSCVSAVLGDHTPTFFDSLRRTGDSAPKVRLSSVLGSVEQSVVDATGGASSPLENAYVTGWYPVSSDPKWNEMKAAVTKYAFDDDRIDVADPGEQTTWIAYTVLTKVVQAMGDKAVTPVSLQNALDHTTRLSTGGLTPELGWTDADLKGVPQYARLVDSKVTYQVIRDGRLVAARPGFIDLGTTLKSTDLS